MSRWERISRIRTEDVVVKRQYHTMDLCDEYALMSRVQLL